jgi:hypothetical protein
MPIRYPRAKSELMENSAAYRVEPSFDGSSHLEPPSPWPASPEGPGEPPRLMQSGIALGVVVAATVMIGIAVTAMTSTFFADRDQVQERRALEERMLSLIALATAPQSALACLDVTSGDAIEVPCEKAIFAAPQSVASAIAYVAARLSLLGDALDYASRGNPNFAKGVAFLRKSVENDHFGFVAQVFATRYGCTASKCDGFAMLKDTSKIVGNLKERVFESLVNKYLPTWQERTASTPPMAALPAPLRPSGANSTLAGGKGLIVPSADSIPAVSIMVDEPQASTRPSGEAGAPAAPSSRAATPQRPARAPQPAPIAPPTQLSPAAQ